MFVSRSMTRKVVTVAPEEGIFKAQELMAANKIRHLPVVDKRGRLVGIVSDRDLRMALPAEIYRHPEMEEEDPNSTGTKVSAVMATNPYRISPCCSLKEHGSALFRSLMKMIKSSELSRTGTCCTDS